MYVLRNCFDLSFFYCFYLFFFFSGRGRGEGVVIYLFIYLFIKFHFEISYVLLYLNSCKFIYLKLPYYIVLYYVMLFWWMKKFLVKKKISTIKLSIKINIGQLTLIRCYINAKTKHTKFLYKVPLALSNQTLSYTADQVIIEIREMV